MPKDSTKNWVASAIFIASAIASLSISSELIQNLLNTIVPSKIEEFYVWSAVFISAAFSLLFGAFLSDKIRFKLKFILIWIISGAIVSLIPVMGIVDITGIVAFSSLFIVVWGIGLPACMSYFAQSTVIENRAKIGGLILFVSLLSGVLSRLLSANEDFLLNSLYLFGLRACSLTGFLFVRNAKLEFSKEKVSRSFISIIGEKSVILYMIPWVLFALVNDLFAPIAATIQSEEFYYSLILLATVFAATFSILSGFFADSVGRKPVIIMGFVMLGLGYAFLGIFTSSIFSWYFYTLVDGMAWGMLFPMFLITLWGDLAAGKSSEKYYAIGFMPFLLSSFLRLTVGPTIADVVPAYSIFSFVAVFLFSAVIPLLYAPETLPEQKIRARELRDYVDKAKKVKDKHV